MGIKVVKTSDQGLRFIMREENVILRVYQDRAGYDTIGCGHLVVDGDPIERWQRDGCSMNEVMQLLADDVKVAEDAVKQHQYDALVSWTFNLGGGALRVSTLRKRLLHGDFDGVPFQMRRWNKSRNPETGELEENPGLVIRREREGNLFASGDYGDFT